MNDRGDHGPGAHHRHDDVGSVGEEAAKLLAALQGWTKEHVSDYSRATAGLGQGYISDGSAACKVCPVCQLIAVVRGINPESLEQLTHAAGQMLNALTGLLESAQHSDRRRDSTVEKIHLSGDDEQEEPRWH